ncbi:hypothetical protein ACJX0J_027504, partial [Zea mays]
PLLIGSLGKYLENSISAISMLSGLLGEGTSPRAVDGVGLRVHSHTTLWAEGMG